MRSAVALTFLAVASAAAAAAAAAAACAPAGPGSVDARSATAATTAPGSAGSAPGSGGTASAAPATAAGAFRAEDVHCGALAADRVLATGAREIAAVAVGDAVAVAALQPTGGAAPDAEPLEEDHDESAHGADAPAGAAPPAKPRPAPTPASPASAAGAALRKTRLLLGVGAPLPDALPPIAESALSPRALAASAHPLGLALAWIEEPGLMFLRADARGRAVGEARLVVRGVKRFRFEHVPARGAHRLVAEDPKGVLAAWLGPDGAVRGEPERLAGIAWEGAPAAAGLGPATGAALLEALARAPGLPGGVLTPLAAARAGKGRAAVVWLDAAGRARAALAECTGL